ncbi:SGNH/GDSL hydrolase family protein [Microbacterium sp. 22296]|uniref:SGNH/GDSL hydrolase family protein n=1 Tax=Microbacterium sp. 22296 TaxID=3453903 RepID=UPI003F851F6E
MTNFGLLGADTKTGEITGVTAEWIAKQTAAAIAAPGGLGILSDSISTYDQATSTTKVTRNWHGLLSVAKGRRVLRSGVYGTGGFTLEQIRDTHLPQLLAATDRPSAVAICGGTNNMSNDASMASGYAALTEMIDTLRANLIRPILWLAPPRGDAALGNVLKWNARVAFLARKLGLQVVDAYTPLASLTTGGIANASTDYQAGDTVHPSAVGHAKIAAYNASLPGWLERFNDAPVQLAYPADASTMMANNEGLFLSDSGHSGYGNGWVQWGTGVSSKSIVTDASGVRWQRMTKLAGLAGQGGLQYNISTGFTPGDLIEIVGRLNVATVEAIYSFGVTAYSGSTLIASGTGGPAGMQGLVYADGVVRARLVVPAGATIVRGELQFNSFTPTADTYVEMAQIAVRNLTALGLS